MVEMTKIRDDIVKVMFAINILSLAISFFISSKAFIVSVIVINSILNGTLIMIAKNGDKFKAQFDKMWSKNG